MKKVDHFLFPVKMHTYLWA